MTSLRSFILVITLAAILPGTLFAAGSRVPPTHGGDVVPAEPYHLELVVNDNVLLVYVTDKAGRDIASAGLVSSAVVTSGQDTVDVKLRPSGGNLLRGRGWFILDPRMTVVVTVRSPGQEAVRATFRPLRKYTP